MRDAGRERVDTYWALAPHELLQRLQSAPHGLSSVQAAERLQRFGFNRLREERQLTRLRVLARQLASPLLLLLMFAASVAAATGELLNAAIVLVILLASILIGYRREYSAHAAAAALRERIKTRTKVLRDGRECMVPLEQVVPGDIVLLSAGSLVPAAAIVLDGADGYVSESVLTGESFPVGKAPGVVASDTPLQKRSNCVHLGTNVRSGTLRCVVAATGEATQFGTIAQRLALHTPQTEFDRGMRRFGYLLTSAMLVMVFVVFVVHMLGGRPLVDTLLFSIALAVGLSPELLPAILSVNLARGAQMLAQHGVLVRHLNAIENLGSMDILCTDKTGTLTEGVITLEGGYDTMGAHSTAVVELGAINAALETGLASPLDDAILAAGKPNLSGVRKLAEIPFDFVRKRVSVVVERDNAVTLITKGAFRHVLDACTTLADGTALDDQERVRLEQHCVDWSRRGIRVLAVASRRLNPQTGYGRSDECDLAFVGFLTFLDRPKPGAAQALADLARTYSSRLIRIRRRGSFCRSRSSGHVVGFLGDGVNDAPAMHAADTSLSVEHAVDVAREAADFVLLERDLDVIRRGIEAGRRTFANTLKYILTTTSANLGNMISMAAASLFLPFLPLLASQILLNNFLSDIPAVGIADDSVDAESIVVPNCFGRAGSSNRC